MESISIRGMAHITGGGIASNLARVLPSHVDALVDTKAWPRPAVFAEIAEIGDINRFSNPRQLKAWLGLVPRQHSSGGKERLGRVSKAGQADIRRLLIIGAMSRLNWMGRKTIPEGSWLARMLARKPRMLVAVALANKMARGIWAMLTKNENYRDPAQAVAA